MRNKLNFQTFAIFAAFAAVTIVFADGGVFAFTNGDVSSEVVETIAGLKVSNLTSEIAEKYGYEKEDGVVVTEVAQGSPAYKEGIRPGDLIKEIERKPIKNVKDYKKITRDLKDNKKVLLLVNRGGATGFFLLKSGKTPLVNIPEPETTIKSIDKEDDSKSVRRRVYVERIGLTVENLTPEIAENLGYKGESGVVISEITQNSPADREALKKGDLINEVERQKITNVNEYQQIIMQLKGSSVLLLVNRRGAKGFFLLKTEKNNRTWKAEFANIPAPGTKTQMSTPTITPTKPSGTRPRFFADIEVSNPRFVEPSRNQALDAEERGSIAFTLENRGRGVAKEVEVSLVLLTDTANLTYPQTTQLGSLTSEEKKDVEIPMSAGFDVADGTATFRIAVSEKWGFEPAPFTVTFDTKAFVSPQLVIDDANIGIDEDKQGDSYGDNDSKIELKETVEVTVAVQNTGAGNAERVKAEVTIEGEGQDIYYNSPSTIFELGNIPAGDYKQFTFAFSTNNRYKRKDLPITVNIAESKGKYGLTKSLGLTVDTPIKSSRDVVVTKIEQPQRTVTPTAPLLTSPADRAPTNAIPQFSDAVAVIFGIEEYRSAPPATFANRDATIFYDYAKSVFGILERNIHLATNELATKGTFDKVFGEDGWISRRVTPNETEVFIFYSGHGAPAMDKSAYIIPQDADPNYAKTTGLALKQIYESLNNLKAKHVTVFIDACFSGSGRPIEKEQKPMLLADARPVFVTVEGPLAYGNMTVMTASTGAQISSGYPEQKHGLFTFYLLMGLHGEANSNDDKAVTAGELKEYLEQHIPNKALELYDREQIPTVQTNEPERVIVQFK